MGGGCDSPASNDPILSAPGDVYVWSFSTIEARPKCQEKNQSRIRQDIRVSDCGILI